MSKLALSIAIGDYDRVRPLVDGSVQIDGVDPVFMLLEPEEIFFRAFRHADFDICELSMSSFTVKTANGDCPYVGVPVFPSRAFRHNSIYIRTDRGIARPEDLKGRRVGVPEYQVTANVWTRAVLEDEYGVKPSDITWVRGGYEQAGRIEKIALNLPPDVHVRGRAGRRHHLRHAGRWRDRCGDRPARAVMLRRAIRMSAGCIPIRPPPRPHGSARRASFRSCTSSASAARWPSSIRGCRSPRSRRSSRRRRARWRSWATSPHRR